MSPTRQNAGTKFKTVLSDDLNTAWAIDVNGNLHYISGAKSDDTAYSMVGIREYGDFGKNISRVSGFQTDHHTIDADGGLRHCLSSVDGYKIVKIAEGTRFIDVVARLNNLGYADKLNNLGYAGAGENGSLVNISGRSIALDVEGNLWTWLYFGKDFIEKPEKQNTNGVKFVQISGYYATDEYGGLWDLSNLGYMDYYNSLGVSDMPFGFRIWQPNPLNTASTWAREGITAALDKGFVPAEIQDNYTNVITRAEFCQMAVDWVMYALGYETLYDLVVNRGLSLDPNAFTDTSDNYILAAFALGITSGTGGGKFTPNGQFDRQSAATMIMNTCRAIGADVSSSPTSDFADLNTAATWAQTGINYVRANGIMSGDGTNFNPKQLYTREQSIITFNNINHNTLPGR